MTDNKTYLRLLYLPLTTSLAVSCFTSVTAPAQAGILASPALSIMPAQLPIGQRIRLRSPSTSTFVQPPPGQGAPRGTVPAGSRGCPQLTQKPLKALVPTTQNPDGTQLLWGVTTEEHPTLWFYVPYATESTTEAKLALRDRNNRTLYETPVTLAGTPGIIGVSLPADAPPLGVDKWYRFYLFVNDINCPGKPPQKDTATAWVKRQALSPTLQTELQAATTVERAKLYAKNGIWYEALTTVAQLINTTSQQGEWSKLLQAVGLNTVANEPIVDCCTTAKR